MPVKSQLESAGIRHRLTASATDRAQPPGSEAAVEILVSQNVLPPFCGRPEDAGDSRCNGCQI